MVKGMPILDASATIFLQWATDSAAQWPVAPPSCSGRYSSSSAVICSKRAREPVKVLPSKSSAAYPPVPGKKRDRPSTSSTSTAKPSATRSSGSGRCAATSFGTT